jgi:general secretion pathway protein K
MNMRANRPAGKESGVILLNVLAVLAIASSVVMMMEALQGVSIARSERLAEAAEADAIARGGEAAAITALRRAGKQTPNSVHYGQAWAHLDETAAPIFGGSFTMRITDAQARFNINVLAHPNLLALDHLRRICMLLGVPSGVADQIAGRLLITGPVERIGDLRALGVDSASLGKLARLTVALSENTLVNLNTAEEPLLAILFGNAGSARQLVAKRDRQGELTPADLAAAKILVPADIGFNSNYFQTDIQVTYGDVTERLSSLLRRKPASGGIAVDVIDRTRSPASPIAPGPQTESN